MVPCITIFGRVLPTYGFFVVLGMISVLLYLRISAHGPLDGDTELVFVWGMVGAFLGAKFLYILVARQLVLSGGFVFYGGFYGLLLAVVLYCKRNRLRIDTTLRKTVPAIPLMHGFGRLGCFCMGCCYGVEHPYGIVFSKSPIAPNGVPLLPVQLYEAGFEFLLFAGLILLKKKTPSGYFLLGVYCVFYGVFRFGIEFFRWDTARGFFLRLSTSQWISFVTVVLGLWLFRKWRKGS